MRKVEIKRTTKETDIQVLLNLDGTGQVSVKSEIHFFNHMLEAFGKHGLFDLEMTIKGDLEVDQHHTIEDAGIVLGQAFKKALGDKKGIKRAGFFIFPMDEALAMATVDISSRAFCMYDIKIESKKLGDFDSELLHDFFQAFANALEATIHLDIQYGRSDHHKVEALFKALGKAMCSACEIENRIKDQVPSTKGVL